MPPIKQLNLKDALEDSPETRKLAQDLELQTTCFHKFVVTLLADCRVIADVQRQMSTATKQLSEHLVQAKTQNFCEKSPFLANAVEQLGESMEQQFSWQEMLHAQLEDGVLKPLQLFLRDDLLEIQKLKENFAAAVQEHDNAMSRYSRVSKRKETEKVRFEANADLYTARKKFHQMALQFYSALNLLSRKREFGVLEPLLSFMHSQLSYFKMGHDILTEEVAKFLTSLSVEIQKERTEHTLDAKRLSGLREKIEQEYSSRYNPDPDPSDPFSEFQPPDLSLSSKSGYLYMRSKTSHGALGSRAQWERMYFSTRDGFLMTWDVDKEPSPMMLLDLSVTANPADYDDRRYVFQVSSTTQELVALQAENERCKEEWIAAIRNIVTERTRKAETIDQAILPSSRLSKEAVQEERKRISNWVDDVIKVEAIRNTPPQERSQRMAVAAPHADAMARVAGAPMAGPAAASTSPRRPVQSTTRGDIPQDFVQTYTVRFLGSLAVQQAKGSAVVEDTMRRVMQARAMQNVYTKVESTMLISSRGLRLIDPSNGAIRTEFRVQDISFAAAHQENQRLFAFITRSSKSGALACHVFESDKSATELCEAMSLALQVAFRTLQARRAQLHQQQQQRLQHHQAQQRQAQQLQAQQYQAQQYQAQQYQAQRRAQQLRQQQQQQRHGGLPPVSGRPGIVDDIAAQGSWSSPPDYQHSPVQAQAPQLGHSTQPRQPVGLGHNSVGLSSTSPQYAAVNKGIAQQPRQAEDGRSHGSAPPSAHAIDSLQTQHVADRPTSASPLSTDSSTTTTSTSSSDIDALSAGLAMSSMQTHEQVVNDSSLAIRENPFNKTAGIVPPEADDISGVITNTMLPGDQWEEPSQRTSTSFGVGLGQDSSEVTAGLGQDSSTVTAGLGQDSSEVTAGLGQDSSEVTAGLGQVSSEVTAGLGQGSSEVTAGLGQDFSEVTAGLGPDSSEVTAGLGQDSSEVTAGLGQDSSQVTGGGVDLMDFSALSYNSTGFVAPSSTPAIPGLLESTAAESAMAIAMAAAASLQEPGVSVGEEDEQQGSPSSPLSDLSDA